MEKVIVLFMAGLLIFTAAYGASYPIKLQNISKYTAGTHNVGIVRNLSGDFTVKSDAACTMYVNHSTATRSKAATGFPLSANETYPFVMPSRGTVTFLCATSAAVKTITVTR